MRIKFCSFYEILQLTFLAYWINQQLLLQTTRPYNVTRFLQCWKSCKNLGNVTSKNFRPALCIKIISQQSLVHPTQFNNLFTQCYWLDTALTKRLWQENDVPLSTPAPLTKAFNFFFIYNQHCPGEGKLAKSAC